MGSFSEEIQIDRAISTVWRTLADIGAIHRWNPGVEASHQVTKGPIGIGAIRHCDLGGQDYLDEEVIEYVPNTSITFRIIKTNMPFKRAVIRFKLQQHEDMTTVRVTPDYVLKYGWFGVVLDMLLIRHVYRNGMRKLLFGLKEFVEIE